jgi:hypothetical protein
MLELVFAGCVALALVAFGFWFLILEGPAPSFAPTQ